ncbi:hypothetical protein, partial [Kribbella yunnanensis]
MKHATTWRRLAASLATLGMLGTATAVLAPSASADVTCMFGGSTMTVKVTDGTAAIGRSGNNLTVNGVPCGLATVTSTDTIDIKGTPGYETVDLAPGLAPGKTAEAGDDEIEVKIDLGANSKPGNGQVVVLRGTAGKDRITIGAAGANV